LIVFAADARESLIMPAMTTDTGQRAERRAREKSATRTDILTSARKVAAREGARNLSLRGVAAEAGFAPAALYGYFRNKDELLVALAADDLSGVAKAMRNAAHGAKDGAPFSAASRIALAFLRDTETLAAASAAFSPVGNASETERLFNGRLIAVLTALSEATGRKADSRTAQGDVVVLAAALAGLAMMARAGRLDALGFTAEELLTRLEKRFTNAL
jgi:AcrR family transcriptional regulator